MRTTQSPLGVRTGLLLPLVLLAAVATSAGCGDDEPERAPAPPAPAVRTPTRAKPPRVVDRVRIPDWVPLYPGSRDPSGYFPMGGGAEAFRYESDDDPDRVASAYGELLTQAGYTVAFMRTPNQGANHGALTANLAEPPRTIRVSVIAGEGGGSTLAFQIESR